MPEAAGFTAWLVGRSCHVRRQARTADLGSLSAGSHAVRSLNSASEKGIAA
jgi:hypothetical protein